MLARSQYIGSYVGLQSAGVRHVRSRSCLVAPSTHSCNSRTVVLCAAKSTTNNSASDGSSNNKRRRTAQPPKYNTVGASQHSSPASNNNSRDRPSSSDIPAGSQHLGSASRADQSSSNAGAPRRPADASADSSKQQGYGRPAHLGDRGGRGGRGGRGSRTMQGGRGGRGPGSSSSSSHDAKQLWLEQSKQRTEAIKASGSPEQLLQFVQQHAAQFTHVNLSAAYTHAVKLCPQGVPPQQQPAAVQQLLSKLHGLAEQLQGKCVARQLANIIWSCGRLGTADIAAMLLPVFLRDRDLQRAEPQGVSNVLWSAATLELQMTPQQVEQLLQSFEVVLQQAGPQAISNTLWAAATMQRQVAPQQVQQILQRFQEVLPQATPQHVANTLWAMATMQQQVPAQQLRPILQHFLQVLPFANPQNVTNTLWALATMQQQVPPGQLQQMFLQLQQVLPEANPQNIANTLWACGKLRYAPLRLLSALEQHPQQLQAVLAASKPQELANMAWACGQLGYRGKLLSGALLQQAAELLRHNASTERLILQDLCNLCWSAVVLDLQQLVPQVLQLALASSNQLRETAKPENLQQLYQVHLWLLDSQLPAPGQGLSDVLSQQQLEQCRASWEQLLAARTQARISNFQQTVYAAAQRLPWSLWQQQPTVEQGTADGLFSIDIAATTASRVKVAIEVDGPTHFVQPGNTTTGPTQSRNRALEARGYTVISIPYWEWNPLRGADEQQKYLLAKLQPALRST